MTKLDIVKDQDITVAKHIKPNNILNLKKNNSTHMTDVYYGESYIGSIKKQTMYQYAKVVQFEKLVKFYNFEFTYLDISHKQAVKMETEINLMRTIKSQDIQKSIAKRKIIFENTNSKFLYQYGSVSRVNEDPERIIKEIQNKQFSDTEIISLGARLAEVISRSVKVTHLNSDINKSIRTVVSAYLNERDIDDALHWLNNIGGYGYDLGKLQTQLQAIKECQKVVEIGDVVRPYVLERLGKLHKEIGALRKAKDLYCRSLALSPNNYFTLNALGGICKQLRIYQEGLEYYSTALTIPDNTDSYSYNGIGAIFRKVREYKNAMIAYKKALDIDENDKFAHRGLGAVYIDQEEFEIALYHFNQSDSGIESLFELYEEYNKENLTSLALMSLELILKLDENNPKAKVLYKAANVK